MSIQKKLLATAVTGALYMVSASAFAQVSISDGSDTDALKYASEINRGTSGVSIANTAGNDLQFTLNYNFSDNEVRYARVECTNLRFTAPTAVTNDSDGDLVLGAINGTGTNAIYFSITDEDDTVDAPTAATVFTVDSAYTLTGANTADSVCTYRLYDTPSQAQAGGDIGLIRQASGIFIDSTQGIVFDTNPGQLTADVEAQDGAYTDFDGEDGVTIGEYDFYAVSGVLNRNGTQITKPDVFASSTLQIVRGNMSFVDTVDDCWNVYSIEGDEAERNINGEDLQDCYVHLHNDETTAIPAGDYTLTIDATVNSGYVWADRTLPLGSIVRNGTQLQAPLAQVPGGWLSRMVLTNTGTAARPYAVEVLGEQGNVIGTANLTGTVPARGTIVVDVASMLRSFTGAPRATLNVTVSAPNNEIQGLYQIVNPDKGSISNHVMVRPGTN